MKLQKYILPIFVGTNLIGQTDQGLFPEMSVGFTHSTYTSLSFKSVPLKPVLNREMRQSREKSKVTEIQYGFSIGLFLWMPLNDGIVFKPKVEALFSNTCSKNDSPIYATSFDINVSHGFVVALKSPDKQGIIYVARNMSCYLTTKQPYLLIGPKLNLKKYDAGYRSKGFENELSFGAFIGYGINYEFHGTNFAPEISYCLTTTAQNKINDSKKVAHTITLAINFF